MVIGNFYMFENISNRFSHAIQKLKGQGRLSEGNIKDALRDCRMALLEADVALPVIKSFIEQVRERALGEEVMRSLTPSQAFIKIVNDQLTEVMGAANEELNLSCQPEQRHSVFLFCLINQFTMASKLTSAPITTVSASFATAIDLVPLVVVSTTSFPLNSSFM